MMTNDNFIADFTANSISQMIILIIFPKSVDLILINICIYGCLLFWKYFINYKKRINYLKEQYQLKYIDLFQSALPFKIMLTHYDKILNTIYPLSINNIFNYQQCFKILISILKSILKQLKLEINQKCSFTNGIFENQQKFYDYLSNHYISREQSTINFETQKKGQLDLKSYLLERFHNIRKAKEKSQKKNINQKYNRQGSLYPDTEEAKRIENLTKIDTLYTYCYDKITEIDFTARNDALLNNEFFIKPTKECIVRVSLLSADLPYLVVIFFDNVDSKFTQNLKDQIEKKNKFLNEYSNVIRDKYQILQQNLSKFNLQLTVQLMLNNLQTFNYQQTQRSEGRLKVNVERFEIGSLINYLKKVFKHKIRINCNEPNFVLNNDYQCLKYICSSLCSSVIDTPNQQQNVSSFFLTKLCILTISIVKYKLYTTLQFNIKNEITEQQYPIDYSDSLKIPQQRSFYDCMQQSIKIQPVKNHSISSQTPQNNFQYLQSVADEITPQYKIKRNSKMRHTLINPQNALNEQKKQNFFMMKKNSMYNNNSSDIPFISKLNSSRKQSLLQSQGSVSTNKVNFVKDNIIKKINISQTQSPLNKAFLPSYEEELYSNKNLLGAQISKEICELKQISPSINSSADKQNIIISPILKNIGLNCNSATINRSIDQKSYSYQQSKLNLNLSPVGTKVINERKAIDQTMQYSSQFSNINLNNQLSKEQTYQPQSPSRLMQKALIDSYNVNFNSSSYYSQIEITMIKQLIKRIGVQDLKAMDNIFDFEILSDISSLVQSFKKNQYNNNESVYNNSNSPYEQGSQKFKISHNCISLLSENSFYGKSNKIIEIPKVKSVISSKRIVSQQNTSQPETLADFEEESRDYSSQQESIRINEHPFGPDFHEGIGLFLKQFNFEKLKNSNNINQVNQFKNRRYSQSLQLI